MGMTKDSQYYKAYFMGYRDGVEAARSGKDLNDLDNDLTKLPVQAMEISSRACNCLIRAGYESVGDIVVLDDFAVHTIRNLGAKTASEIARWLDANGICYSAWCNYL